MSVETRPAPDNSALPRVAILGVGQMGLVCASILRTAGHHVTLWAHDPAEAADLTQTRTSSRLPGTRLPDGIHVSAKLQDVLQPIPSSGLIVSAIPVQFMASVWEQASRHVGPGVAVVSVAKGIEIGTLRRPTEIIAQALGSTGPNRVACLSGPTIATELARCLPAAMVAASPDPALAQRVQRSFGSGFVRIYTHADVPGVELAGAMKNVIAIAAGILDGLNAGCNAKSAMLARGLAEIVRLGIALGSQPETFFGIAGVGDLATTCFSPEGRNRSCGEALGRGEPLEAYLARTPSVVEGVATTKSVMELARRYGIEMPITAAVHAVLFEGVDPLEAIGRLMTRAPKPERIG